MCRAVFSVLRLVTPFVAFPASALAAFHTARAGPAIALIILERCEVVNVQTASFEPARQLCFMEIS